MVATTHDENTIPKVREALMVALGGSTNLMDDCITEMLNAGILFRERAPEGQVGEEGNIPEPAEQREESNLVLHTRRELELVGEEKETIDGYCRVIQAFADMGHSGGSASVAIPTINMLLQYQNLKPLTDDPDEWIQHGSDVWPPDGIYQSKRRPDAFSSDGGKTYYLLDEVEKDDEKVMHTSESKAT